MQEIIRHTQPRSFASAEPWVRGVLSLRGHIVPVYDLADRLGVVTTADEHSKIVIIETESEVAGVIVDAVEEVLTIDRDQVEPAPAADPTIIDSIAEIGGRLVVLINPATIFASLQMFAS